MIRALRGENESVELVLDEIRSVFIQGIAGSAMTGTALLLREMHREVRGSDAHPGPPMQALLDYHGIEVLKGYNPANLDSQPDLVITGNVLPRDNPECAAVRERRIPYTSFPQFLEDAILPERRTVVMTGTHGKTTCTALAAHLLSKEERVGFLCGGIVRDQMSNAQLGREWFVVEGDEYETAYFAHHPKFTHYHGEGILLTSVDHDHIDLYPTEEIYNDLFLTFAANQSDRAVIVVHEGVPFLDRLMEVFPGRVVSYGEGEFNPWRLAAWQPEWHLVTLENGGRQWTFHTPLFGLHNALNLTGVVALLAELSVDPATLGEAIRSFQGVKKRQEILFSSPGTIVVDDFAHHPTAVALTIEGFRQAYPRHTLTAVFEPRSNTSRTHRFQKAYTQSLKWADEVFLIQPPACSPLTHEEPFNCGQTVQSIRDHGVSAVSCGSPEEVFDRIVERLVTPRVILCMSNGPMNGLPGRLAAYFEAHVSAPI